MGYAGFTKQGTVDEDALTIGEWEEIISVVSSTDYFLGSCKEGTLTVSRSYYEHSSSKFPGRIDHVIPLATGMTFSGNLEEIHIQNVAFCCGQTPNQGTANYVYIGAQNAPLYQTIRGRKIRQASDDFQIEFCIFKGHVVSEFTFGSSDEAIQMPFEVRGMDDEDGDYGGSATMPIGWVYGPVKG